MTGLNGSGFSGFTKDLIAAVYHTRELAMENGTKVRIITTKHWTGTVKGHEWDVMFNRETYHVEVEMMPGYTIIMGYGHIEGEDGAFPEMMRAVWTAKPFY